MVFFMAYQLLWLYGSINPRIGSKRKLQREDAPLRPEAIYTKTVIKELRQIFYFDDLPPHASSEECSNYIQKKHIIPAALLGVVLVKPAYILGLGTNRTTSVSVLRDYFLATKYSKDQLAVLEVVERAYFDAPPSVHRHTTTGSPLSFFWKMPPMSFQTASTSLCSGSDDDVQTVVESWVSKHNLDPEALGVRDVRQEGYRIVMTVPLPHALCLVHGNWKHTGFPLVHGRKSCNAGFQYVATLWQSVRLNPVDAHAEAIDEVGTQVDGGNDIRMSVEQLDSIVASLRDGIAMDSSSTYRKNLAWLQSRRDYLMLSELRLSAKSFDIEVLINVVLGSAHLRSASSFNRTMQHGVRAIIADPAVRDYFLDMLT